MGLGAFVAALALALAEPAAGPDDELRCVDASGRDQCAEWIREAFARVALPAAESMVGRPGWTLRLALHRNQNISPALVVTADGRGRGRAEVVAQRGRRSAPGPAFAIDLGSDQLAEAKRLADLVSRIPPDDPGGSKTIDGEFMVCTSHASIVFETVLNGAVTRRARGGCFDEGASDGASALVQRVLARLPACAPVVEWMRRAGFSALEACAGLEGDLGAAAETWLRYGDLLKATRDGDTKDSIRQFFAPAAELITAEGVYKGRADVAASWRNLDWHYAHRVRGDSPVRVTIEGNAYRSIESPGGAEDNPATRERAPFAQRWIKRGGVWRMEEMRVGTFMVYRPDEGP